MLRITKQTDYGIMLVAHLASLPAGRIVSARDAADGTGLPVPMVSKILKALARGGLLSSHRGVKGGYSLARRPDQISVAEIIWALEGPIAMTECIDDLPVECQQQSSCPIQGNWQRINHAIRGALEGISLRDMALPEAPLVQLGGERATRADLCR